ncbi:cyclophilin-like fold protein [Pseudomonas siliginis]|uniref:cyclophilin-like fold protein n=1 Tax=Pseudomonas siliginis TaxID=2842346 RepID=UPI0020939175|nr:cyclophilin-like fold protein [Pseudomonas siliginis]UST92468.1 cyclophilin-like fold protein [Pseudomonas siliginis]
MRIFANGWKGFVLMAWLPFALSAANPEEITMWMTVGEHRFAIALEDNPSTRQLLTRLPLSLNMSDLHSNEKYATVQPPLPTQPYRPGTIHTGDFLLYGDDTLVVFYKTFDSSYRYSRLGRIERPQDLAEVLGRGDVRLTFTLDE